MRGEKIFQEKVTQITREQVTDMLKEKYCPCDFGLENYCFDDDGTCMKCWKYALEKEYD